MSDILFAHSKVGKTGGETPMGVCNVAAINEDVGVVKQAAKILILNQNFNLTKRSKSVSSSKSKSVSG